ncbi:class I SAM-dependent methyltransferase [Microvirga pudoricolor]|uniref:class I SAM-dependent methyltransferase n=1 Tax=Microvirga pudoricolor TaxID=2778729 RepID=UPI0019519EEC|nr:SAM-dependent methyltransferase [Microvirga pudoricolor]MBM6592763.1 SAM-dependent methyltransferase [Microvirga pudoricolor]
MTEFEKGLRQLIALEGPLTVERYMGLCLGHYYATRDPLGADGDFTTAPEISQMFGELVGLWLAEVWTAMDRPATVRVVEIGPGRGTLMADALRAARILPGFQAALDVHLVETSPALRERQRAVLAGSGLTAQWHDDLESLPDGPVLLVANEFFDALPVRQYVATDRGWCERLVGIEGAALTFGLRAEPESLPQRPRRPGDVLEVPLASIAIARALGRRIARDGGAALLIDYGYWGPALGDTLQALRRHEYVDPLAEPGEADLTTHVDFHHLARAAAAEGARAHGLATQGDFLHALGISARAEALKRRASPPQAESIERALARLTNCGETGMGSLFKVLALSHPGLESLPGLPVGTPRPAES